LDGLGDIAFLNDVLGRSGSTVQSRTVSVVFRTSNVIVTIGYTGQPAHTGEVPDSKELQEKARGLAKTLAGQFNE
jgi:deoxycytidylate deaminase